MKIITKCCGIIMLLFWANSSQAQSLSMQVLNAPSTDTQQCFYVHINSSQVANSIIITGNEQSSSCAMTLGCPATICYDRPLYQAREEWIECEVNLGNNALIDGCIVTIWPRIAEEAPNECANLVIVPNCGYLSPCQAGEVSPGSITHLTVGVLDDDGNMSYLAWSGTMANISWYTNDSPDPIHTGAWIEYDPNETYYVKVVLYRRDGTEIHCGQGQSWGSSLGSLSMFRTDTNPPVNLSTLSNYPNPFSSNTAIAFELEEDVPVTLRVMNIQGEVIQTLINQKPMDKGHYQFLFNGQKYPSGIYYFSLQAGNYTGTHKMNIIH